MLLEEQANLHCKGELTSIVEPVAVADVALVLVSVLDEDDLQYKNSTKYVQKNVYKTRKAQVHRQIRSGFGGPTM